MPQVCYGDIGEEGMISVKEHKDAATASKFADAKIAEKISRGYVTASVSDTRLLGVNGRPAFQDFNLWSEF